jgi:transcriptional regulator with XRE-family HTH domain
MKKDVLRLANPDPCEGDVAGSEGALLVATNVARLRAQRGMSEEALAERVGLTGKALRDRFDGREMPRLDLLWKIATVLRVPFGTLVRPLRRDL